MQWPNVNKLDSESTTTFNIPRVAIIGAGITGAFSAHHLHQLTRLYQPLDITVFDSEEQVGGRIRSAYVHNKSAFNVECGAATFTDDDWCIKEAMREVGLKPTRSTLNDDVGVWDGHDLLVSYGDKDKPLSGTWWQSPKWLWRYGLSLSKVQEMIVKNAESFSSLAALQPFLRLSEELEESFSRQDVSESASSFLEKTDVNVKLVNEVIRAESRYRHAYDLHQVNTLSSLLALRSAPELAIYQGNQRLPHRMLKISKAQNRLNTRVSRITSGKERRWKIYTQLTQLSHSEAEFDIIIITASFAFNNITIDPLSSTLSTATKAKSYVERHVTLFSTLDRLSPAYFNLPPNKTLPERILTAPRTQAALSSEGNHDSNDNEVFSITIADRVPPPDSLDREDELEYVYKIISSHPIPNDEIVRLLGHQPDSHKTLQSFGVTWVHRKVWPHAYARFTPGEPILDNLEIAPDMYYTAAAEEVVGTMEMGCRMGLNVAKHLYNSKWVPETYP